MSRTVFLISLLCLVAIPVIACDGKDARADRFDPSKLGTIDRDITYSEIDGVSLKMDIYHPMTGNGPAAAVLVIHGGGWTGGDKKDVDYNADISPLVNAGFLVAAVNYRFPPQYMFPAQLEDVKCAVRFLRASSGQYDIDPDRIAAMGRSAGGHLASLLGVTGDREELEARGGYQDQSSQVEAVVDMFGPSDLTQEAPGKALELRVITPAFGTTDRQAEILHTASPVSYITPSAPPFLILQGEKDVVVPPSQSQDFDYLLRDAGVRSQLVMVKNAGHEFVPAGGQVNPSFPEISRTIVDFLQATLT